MPGGNIHLESPFSIGFLICSSEINVAYQGTSVDLMDGGDAALFDSLTWDEGLMGSTESLPLDTFNPINGNNGTVSPKDLLNDALASLPPSTAFSNLTTPGSAFLDTPDDAFEPSPLFTDTLGADPNDDDQWYSLFPENTDKPLSPPTNVMSRTISSTSSNKHVMVHPGGEIRKRSSTTATPMTPAVRPSSIAGVHKRDRPLPPIVVDESDTVALKRARNTAAARKSRDKKVKERDALESRIQELENEVEHWKALALAHSAMEE